ncbi:ATP-binding cassette sub-family A member 3 [Folsomia candida]|uniref:Dolichol-phosphate mannose synthase subunit 3 n=1 Tax=Folsomia candida TaxID=158441 RepID=A0A226ELG9_FOLCA|nr:ATP-binding cassette sub-family A member 3 [Folsomia candida]
MAQSNFRKLRLLLQKNLILRKRQYIVTTLEIILPTIFAILMAYMRARMRELPQSDLFEKDTYFEASTEEELLTSSFNSIFRYSSVNVTTQVGYSPNDPVVKAFLEVELMNKLVNLTDGEVPVNIEWLGFESDREIETFVAEQGFSFNPDIPRMRLALVVNGLLQSGNEYPNNHKISYKIRLVDEFYDTSELFPWTTAGPSACAFENLNYRYSGFSGLQILIDKLLTTKLTSQETTHTYGVAVPLEPGYSDQSLVEKLFLCLSPNMALHYALKILSGYEAKKDVGAQWKYIAKPVSTMDSLTLLHIIGMFLVTSVIYTLLAMYLESVLPTKYGVRKPWYFIFLPSTWGLNKRNSNDISDLSALRENLGSSSEDASFEKVPTDLKVGLEILQLRKEFGSKTVVNNVSVQAYEGQIFCLLGHNGAGKTTTMSILTGLLSPSGGTALINNKDIRTEMNDIRQELGLCPQHNLLFGKLSVKEHLKFFGMVKGLNRSEVDSEIDDLIRKLQLEDKLSLGCAIVGGSKVLILDECSSGLDPEVRRVIWDLLLEIRTKRTIILTTHFLEEADVLGDRIAIMASGKIKCCGSSMFLKKHFGTGYSLTASLAPFSDSNRVLQIIHEHIPLAFIKSEVSKSDVIELEIALNSQGNSSSQFPAMFNQLLAQKSGLGLLDVGMSLTSMDDVFLKVEELEHTSSDHEAQSHMSTESLIIDDYATGFLLWVQQFWTLLMKKMLYSMRRWKLLAIQMILPVAMLISAVLITNIAYNTYNRTPPLTISLSSYKDQIVLYRSSSNPESQDLGEQYNRFVGSPARQIPSDRNLSVELIGVGHAEEETYFQRYIVAADLNSASDLNVMHSSIARHSCPLAVNLASNAVLRQLAPEKSYTLEVTNHPLSSRARRMFDAASENPEFTEVAPFVVGIMVSIGLALLAASFIVMPIEERKCKGKQLQLMTGVNPIIYWGAAFLWDFFLTVICISAMVGCLFIFQKYEGFTNNGGAGVVFLIMFVYSVGAIIFSQLMSLVGQTPAGGFAMVTIIHIITGIGCALGSFILEDEEFLIESKTIGWIGRLFPTYGVSKSLMLFSKSSTRNSRCNVLSADLKNILCKPVEFIDITRFQSCCDNCEELGAVCFEPDDYLIWEYGPDNLPKIGQELTYMFIMGCIYFVVLVLIEFGWMKQILNIIWKQADINFIMNSNDEDVQVETDRVKDMILRGATSEDAIIVDNLSKSYGSFSAVSKLTFGVHRGECFGLLGVNGAGKTTSFKMLTGDEIISNGDAWINFEALQGNRKSFLSRIGYCPQFDGIIGVLSGKEMLEIFARLRGIKNKDVKLAAETWLDRFGLLQSGNIQCQNYSGGMKRRLSAAMALIGDPPLILLDEPTTGVDPVSRRKFWKIISSLKDQGRSIILTSHSMEECEHLCDRLGIMVNGELQCIGRVPHLKNKFAQGYTLTIRAKADALSTQTEGYLTALVYQVTTQLHPCILKDNHQNVTQFHIQSTDMTLDRIFHIMEDIKFGQFSSFIEEYSVQQTTLEEVFLSFAKKQYNMERVVQTSKFRKLLALGVGVWLTLMSFANCNTLYYKCFLFPLPFWALVVFGVYSGSTVLYRTFTFNDCPEAAKELLEEIDMARADLKRKGMKSLQ